MLCLFVEFTNVPGAGEGNGARAEEASRASPGLREEGEDDKQGEETKDVWLDARFLLALLSWEETCAFEDWGIWVGGAAKHAMMSVVYLWFCQCFAFLGLRVAVVRMPLPFCFLCAINQLSMRAPTWQCCA